MTLVEASWHSICFAAGSRERSVYSSRPIVRGVFGLAVLLLASSAAGQQRGRSVSPQPTQSDLEAIVASQRVLGRAKLWLYRSHPFVGHLALRAPLAPVSWLSGMGTDGRCIYYNPRDVAKASTEHVLDQLVHQLVHSALAHPLRGPPADDPRAWDAACDRVVNQTLFELGLPLPSRVVRDRGPAERLSRQIAASGRYEGRGDDEHPWSRRAATDGGGRGNGQQDIAERGEKRAARTSSGGQEKEKEEQGNRQASTERARANDADRAADGDDRSEQRPERGERGGEQTGQQRQSPGQEPQRSIEPGAHGSGLSEAAAAALASLSQEDLDRWSAPPAPPVGRDREMLRAEWRERVEQAARAAGELPAGLRRDLPEAMARAKLPWDALTRDFVARNARSETSYARPSRRSFGQSSSLIFPGQHSLELDAVVALDVSGSITAADLAEMLPEVEAMRSRAKANFTLLAVDAELKGSWSFGPGQPLQWNQIEIEGGGGTSFVPAFEWVVDSGRRPDLLIYLTDALGEYPAARPQYPVLWVVKGGGVDLPPWGLVVDFDQKKRTDR